jgi:predicted AAA+ superfamily ATPase
MLIRREIEDIIDRYKKFPVIAILGPRQSGKTTLAKMVFSDYTFISLEDPILREYARTDPRSFLQHYSQGKGLIIDEFQYVPDLLSYIQLIVDEHKRPGFFVLTGSQNFLINHAISQSLAGRVGILTLLPLSIQELKQNNLLPSHYNRYIVQGSYPRVYAENISYLETYSAYIATYIERDVRLLTNVGNLTTFQTFLTLCAGRIGQLLNLSDIALSCGISVPTATRWLSILEASYIVFRLQPHFTNFNKRLIKTPKLYFYDTGVASHLLSIIDPQAITFSPFKGPLFENMIISDIVKQFYNLGLRPPIYFWRDKNAHTEIDLLIDINQQLTPVEIKASETISSSFFGPITQWNELSQTDPKQNIIIYGGKEGQTRSAGTVLGWESTTNLAKNIIHKKRE